MKSKRGYQSPTNKEINDWFNWLFSPVSSDNEATDYVNAVYAFENLTGFYILHVLGHSGSLSARALKSVHFDYIGLISMLRRFQRDAYGLHNFNDFTNSLVKNGQLQVRTQVEVLEKAASLGLPIASVNPKKTRIAAAFSLWMSVFRPVCINPNKLPKTKPDELGLFCAGLNFFLASTFLSKFGYVHLDEPGDDNETYFIVKIKYDLTYRGVNIASLATLYDAIFSVRPRKFHQGEPYESSQLPEPIKTEDIFGIPVSIKTVKKSAAKIANAKDIFGNEF